MDEAIPFDVDTWEAIGREALNDEDFRLSSHPRHHRLSPLAAHPPSPSDVSKRIMGGIKVLEAMWHSLDMYRGEEVSPIFAGGFVLNAIMQPTRDSICKPEPKPRSKSKWANDDSDEESEDEHDPGTEWEAGDLDIFIVGPLEATGIRHLILHELISKVKFDIILRSEFAITLKTPIYDSDELPDIQVVLAKSPSIADTLSSFDIDPCCFAFDGERLYGMKRGIVALYNRVNYYHPEKATHAYEYRISKYCSRGFDFIIPSEYDVDIPTIDIEKRWGLSRIINHNRMSHDELGWVVSIYDEELIHNGIDNKCLIEELYGLVTQSIQDSINGLTLPRHKMLIGKGNNDDRKEDIETILEGRQGTLVCEIANTLLSSAVYKLESCLSSRLIASTKWDAVQDLLTELKGYSIADIPYASLDLGVVKFETTVEEMKIKGQGYMTDDQKHDWLCRGDSRDYDFTYGL